MSAQVTINTKQVENELEKKKELALYAIGNVVLEKAVEAISGDYTPSNLAVDTGRLRASLSFITPKLHYSGKSFVPSAASAEGDWLEGVTDENDTVLIGTNVEYAQFVHNGTVKMAARPFLLEGVNAAQDRVGELLTQILGEGNFDLDIDTEGMNYLSDLPTL